jgi:hypothetical protein
MHLAFDAIPSSVGLSQIVDSLYVCMCCQILHQNQSLPSRSEDAVADCVQWNYSCDSRGQPLVVAYAGVAGACGLLLQLSLVVVAEARMRRLLRMHRQIAPEWSSPRLNRPAPTHPQSLLVLSLRVGTHTTVQTYLHRHQIVRTVQLGGQKLLSQSLRLRLCLP